MSLKRVMKVERCWQRATTRLCQSKRRTAAQISWAFIPIYCQSLVMVSIIRHLAPPWISRTPLRLISRIPLLSINNKNITGLPRGRWRGCQRCLWPIMIPALTSLTQLFHPSWRCRHKSTNLAAETLKRHLFKALASNRKKVLSKEQKTTEKKMLWRICSQTTPKWPL